MSWGDALSQSYPAVAEAVPEARRALTDVAAAAGAGGERLEEIRLAVSEALTNAVVHAYDGDQTGSFQVTAAVASGELWVLISDDGRGLHAGNDTRGHCIGLSLISGLSDDFAVVTRASGGTEVQMRFDLKQSHAGTPEIILADHAARQPRRPDLASQR
jgi:anti-sigma regulatory factor (Ser/Thr protein kinase)